MTDMQNLDIKLNEAERQQAVHDRAMASIRARETRREASGYAVMAAADGYGAALHGGGVFGRVSHGAKLFCILFAFLAPSLLVWRVLL